MVRVALRLAAYFCSILVLVCVCCGQTYTGGLTGAVADPAVAFVPAASLKLTNLDTNDARRQTTDGTGEYTFTALPPGRYRLELEHPGFKRFVQEPIEVRVQQFITLNPVLEVGTGTQVVEVSGQVALLDAATSSLSQVVENRQVTELPLNGRNTLALVALTPGIRTHGQFMDNTATRSFAGWGNFSSNAALAHPNQILAARAPPPLLLPNPPSRVPPPDPP